MVGNPESPKPLFWLTHRHDGRAAGVVVIESRGDLLRARLKVALAGADRGLEFVSAHQLHQESAGQIPANMIGSLLDDIAGSCTGCFLGRSRRRHFYGGGRPASVGLASHDPARS
jgi:hypothetical protein